VNHQDLANQFNNFSYQLITTHSDISDKIISIQDDIFFRRIIFSRYYYALYHKYLAHDEKLSKSTASGKHETIIKKLKSSPQRDCKKLFQFFIKLKNLRVWADYNLDEKNVQALNIKLDILSSDVYKIINKKNITC